MRVRDRHKRWAGAWLVVSLCAARAFAADRLLFIGGGPLPADSQVSIESNVIWIDDLLRGRAFASHELLFTTSDKAIPDVVLHAPNDPQVQRWLPLARLYGEQQAGVSVFRRNRVPRVNGAATAEGVTDALARSLRALGSGDSLLVVYNGHGSWGEPDATHNALRLWGESQLDVRQFASLLQSRPPGSAVRYIFPQCFSGAFARSVFGKAQRPDASAVQPEQCGFFAVSENHEAEGCTPGVDVGEYRDYSTYFFAALAGKARDGGALTRDPDLDHNGRISLGEAHDYAYTEALSTDIPFSTSEYFLEVWQPWYVRWQSAIAIAADDPYLQRALRLAEQHGIAVREPAALAREALARRTATQQEIDAAQARIEALEAQEQEIRARLLSEFELRWPAARQPYSHAFLELIAAQGEALLGWIRAQAQYTELEALQAQIEREDLARLELQRRSAGLARIQRMVKLAAIKAHFDRVASAQARAAYAGLLRCESWVMPEPGRTGRD